MGQSESKDYLEQRYGAAIQYYWRVSVRNKFAYKWSRYLVIMLGSAVTLVGSLSVFKTFVAQPIILQVATPTLAALLTILTGFSQSFQWGASWREMVLTAERLQKEFDRIRVTAVENLDVAAELDLLNEYVIAESSGFFDRVMGSSSPPLVAMRRDKAPPVLPPA